MRHMAWLHAVPEGSKNSRLKSFKALDENSSFLQLPNIEGAEYLVALLSEVGFVSYSGVGAIAITWSEIESWLNCTELNLSIWEKLMLKEMSEAYASVLSTATDKHTPAPYIHEVEDIEAQRTKVANKLRSVFNSLKRKRNGEPSPQ